MSEIGKRFPHGGGCRHFNGIQHDACQVGVSFDTLQRADVLGPWSSKLPCIRPDGKTWCAKHDPFTPDEMQAQEDKAMDETKYVLDALVAVAESGKSHGSVTCPRCLGVLRFAHASNKHIRARCDTPDCLAFMS